MENQGYHKLVTEKQTEKPKEPQVTSSPAELAHSTALPVQSQSPNSQQNYQANVPVGIPYQGVPPAGYPGGAPPPPPPPQANVQYQPAVNVVQHHQYQVHAHHAIPKEAHLPDHSIYMRCPRCNNAGNSRITHEIGTCTICAACGLWFLTGIFCCWIPYVVDSCKDAVHFCPYCNQELGAHKQC